MKKKNILMSVIAILAIVTIAIAAVPPPPANQLIGFYDTSINLLTATTCHGASCHGTDDTVIANRHHMLVPNEWNCQNCHVTTPGQGQGILVERDCIQCHNGTAWRGGSTGLNIGRPHHNTTAAQTRQCGNTTGCHGSFVDNYDDTHYVPLYSVSLITPNATYNKYNATSGRYWGGCWGCHLKNTSADPVIQSNGLTHHTALNISTDRPQQCLWCHGAPSVLGIRYCEQCHSVKTVHNIQYNYVSNGPLGYGHINNNWDCWGCHAFWDAGADNPFAGPVVPDLTTMSPNKVTAGVATNMVITGTNFVQDTYLTTVSIDGVSYTPGRIQNSQIAISIPALAAGVHDVKLVKGGGVMSQTVGLIAIPPVSITSAELGSGVMTLVGKGFGTKPGSDAQNYVIVEHNGVMYQADSITGWSDEQIVATSSVAASGDKVTVLVSAGGLASALLTGTTPTPTTTPNPVDITSAKLSGTTSKPTVTIEGTGFGSRPLGAYGVYLKKNDKTTKMTISSWSTTNIIVKRNTNIGTAAVGDVVEVRLKAGIDNETIATQ